MASTLHAQSLTFTTLAGPAGGPGWEDATGSEARFNIPIGMAVDGSGNVYVADSGNSTIRKITPAGVVTTLAGVAGISTSQDGRGGDARFKGPSGVAVDGSGNVYVADTGNNTIRKITAARVVTTLAGLPGISGKGSADGAGAVARFNGPAGVATDSIGNVYVADTENHTIRRVTPTGVVTTLAGSAGVAGRVDGTGSVARFRRPWAVATDSSGNVYVSDRGNSTIRRITSAGVVTTLAGSSSGSADGTGSAAQFNASMGVATDSGGNVYVADFFNSTIRKVTSAGVVTTLAGSADLEGIEDGTGSAARFNLPSGLAVDRSGNVYVADYQEHTIRKITPAAVVTTLAGLAGPSGSADGSGSTARFKRPAGVATDSAGNVYVADMYNHTIRRITTAGVVTTLAGSAGVGGGEDGTGSAARFLFPKGVAPDSAGNVYVTDWGNGTIRKITPAGVVTTLAGSAGLYGGTDGTGSAARFGEVDGAATDSVGNVYVADATNHTIRRITPAGVVTTIAGSSLISGSADGTGAAARFHNPAGVATDSSGNVYVADQANQTIRKITPAAVVTTIAGIAGLSGSSDIFGGRFFNPTGVATDSAGTVYVADAGNHAIRKITPAGVVTTLAGFAGLSGSVDGTALVASFARPTGVATDSAGNLYVVDSDNHEVRIGRPALADAAELFPIGTVGEVCELDTSGETATSWQWRVIRRPSGSTAQLSSTSIPNPTFIPDIPDLYVFQLTASNGVNTSITTVSLIVTGEEPVVLPTPRRRAVRHGP